MGWTAVHATSHRQTASDNELRLSKQSHRAQTSPSTDNCLEVFDLASRQSYETPDTICVLDDPDHN